MKLRIPLLIASILQVIVASSQIEKQIDTSINHTTPIIPTEKVELLKNIDVIANMQYGFNNDFQDGKYVGSAFSMNQFRLEIKGKVYKDKVYFRFRDRYTKSTQPQSVDNISASTDLAYIGVNLSPKVSMQFGKMCADWGGYEFDANPIDIYAYNDIVEYADNFLSGVQLGWQLTKNHSLTFQILNSRTKTFDELYDSIPGVKQSKFPAAWVANWRGNFANGMFQTLWSASVFTEAVDKEMHYIALGNQLLLKKWTIQYDFKWSKEGLDRKTIVTGIVPDSYDPYAAMDVAYIEHWLRFTYQFAPKWTVSGIGMVSDAYWYGNPDPHKDSHLRTAWGFIPSVEFYPFKNFNLKFFGTYIGRTYKYTDYSKKEFGSADTHTGRISIGFISPLVVL
ncbi:porin [Danxiaibacter flavus]|uniref:Porin n=1 Tax=Danxiaibacter flavus TaxID=3049108 RepID=A0ABV3ZMI0_9BACT|nr:porin [Chitinophagaceae bacterium DXS]